MTLAEEMALEPTVEEVIAEAVAAERERCAKLCEEWAQCPPQSSSNSEGARWLREAARQFRTLK